METYLMFCVAHFLTANIAGSFGTIVFVLADLLSSPSETDAVSDSDGSSGVCLLFLFLFRLCLLVVVACSVLGRFSLVSGVVSTCFGFFWFAYTRLFGSGRFFHTIYVIIIDQTGRLLFLH